MISDCVFCDLASDQLVVSQIEPLNPVAPGHLLFVPREHAVNAAANPALAGLVFQMAAEYGHEVGDPFNLITSAGSDATQTVWHLHVHYVPRERGDGLHLPWTGQDTGQ